MSKTLPGTSQLGSMEVTAIGGRANNSSGAAVCKVKNLRLYNRALAPEEIAHNYAIDKIRFSIQ